MAGPIDPQDLLSLTYPNWANGQRSPPPPPPPRGSLPSASPSSSSAAAAGSGLLPPPPPLGLPYGLLLEGMAEEVAAAADSIGDIKPQQKHNHHRRKSVKTMRYGGHSLNQTDKNVVVKVRRKSDGEG